MSIFVIDFLSRFVLDFLFFKNLIVLLPSAAGLGPLVGCHGLGGHEGALAGWRSLCACSWLRLRLRWLVFGLVWLVGSLLKEAGRCGCCLSSCGRPCPAVCRLTACPTPTPCTAYCLRSPWEAVLPAHDLGCVCAGPERPREVFDESHSDWVLHLILLFDQNDF